MDIEVRDLDTLTGFRTARSFERTFTQELHATLEKNGVLSLTITDLDNFRRFNEKFGSRFGNDVLKKLAECFSSHIPETSVPGRFGGEEFIILLPNTEREEAFLLVERIRSEWDAVQEFSDGQETVQAKLTISGGIASYPADGSTVPEVLRKAEQALYRAKVSGRNRICIAQEEKMIPKTAHYTATQLERLSKLAEEKDVADAILLREALDGLLRKYTISEKLQ